jgi:hypothetical protein
MIRTNKQTDDALNAAAGGCAAGFIAGVRARSLPLAFGACAAMGTAIGTFSAAGNVSALSTFQWFQTDKQSLTGTDRMSIPRPEREERRLKFFKQRDQPAEKSAYEVIS